MKITIQDARTSVTLQQRDFRVTISGARGPAGPQGDPGEGGEWGTIVGDITEQTDLYTALEDKVPYTGATGNLNLGEQKLLFANASELREGTYDFGGQGGISQICSVGFENNWQSGFNHIFDNNGLIRESLHCFDIVPDSSFDSSLRFKIGSLWKLDDGTIYECTDATLGAAVWQLYNPYATDTTNLVPYTGATQDVNLGEYGAQLGNLEFDNTPTNVPTSAGSVYWNDTDGTLNLVLKGGQVISRIGETQHIRALNNTGAQIARGKVVYVVGAQGQRLTIGLADADTEILSKDTIGFTAEAIADGAEGFVIVQGVINNVSTTGMTDGASVYLSQTAGGYTTTAPTDPAHMVVLGFIVNGGSGGAGSIYVKVDNGYELEELHGVADAAKVTPVGADALLLRDSADNNLWKRLTWTNALAGVKTHMDTFKSVAGGYASLDGSGKVPASELPSYVDDVVEVANYAALPGTGETGKIYVTLDTNKCYRWSGSVYVEVSAGGGIDTLTTTGTSGAATLVGSTLNIPQYQGVLTNPVTGTGTAGQVAYFSGTSAVTGSANLFWDNTNQRLDIIGKDALNATNSFIIKDNANRNLFYVKNDGEVGNAVTGSTQLQWRFGTSATNSVLTLIRQSTTTVLSSGNSGNAFVGTESNQPFGILSNNNLRIFIEAAGNVAIGLTSSISARLHVRGSGTTSATTALLVQNSTPTELFKVTDNGAWNFNGDGVVKGSGNTSGTTALTVQNSDSTNLLRIRNDARITLADNVSFSPNSSTGVFGFVGDENRAIDFGLSGNNISSSGSRSYISITKGFAPTSGTAIHNALTYSGTINQTGGANGITRGLYVNPTLTAAADWRSIEFSNNSGWGIYGAGTADSYFGGRISIGTTLQSQGLRIGRTPTTADSVSNFVNVAIPNTVTSIYRGFATSIGLNATGFTLPNLSHFEAINDGTHTAGVVTNLYGFRENLGTYSATNVYGFYGNIASGTGRWNLYMNGTAANYLAGNTSIGTTTESARLLVRGSGTTSATTALLVQNSTPTALMSVRDDGKVIIGITTAAYVEVGTLSNFYNVSAGYTHQFRAGGSNCMAIQADGRLDFIEGGNIQIGTTTGTKIGTATSQKIGLWNATPIAQPTTAVAAATRVGGAGNTVTDADTFDGYTIAQLVKALRNIGALA